MRGFTFWSSIACYLVAACGGVTTDHGRSQGVSGNGTGGGRVIRDYDASFEPAPPGSGGAGAVPASGKGGYPGGPVATSPRGPGDGGAPPSIRGDGGARPSFASGGATGGSVSPTGGAVTVATGGSAGASCRNVFEPMEWGGRCAPSAECLNLAPSSWSPVVDTPEPSVDAGPVQGTEVAEAQFCSAPAKRNYLFAFEASGASYDAFNIATGDAACSGRSLAYLGIGGIGDAPLTKVRTHCFSVDGALLGSHIAVVGRDGAVVSNLRAVSACPCPYPIPYNVNTCPDVEGSAGHPNCG